jgi:hypothetical protein
MNKKFLAVAISAIAVIGTSAVAGSLVSEGSSVVVAKSKDNRAQKPYMNQRPGTNGYLNPGNSEDFAVIMEHIGYANTTPEESPMFFKMVQQARTEALMRPTLYPEAIARLAVEETMHHSVLAPKAFVNAKTNEERLINSATVNVTGDLSFGYTTVVLKDPSGKQIGVPGSRRTYASEANRSLALGDIDASYIAANYKETDQFTIESFAMTKDTSGQSQFHKMTNKVYARALMSGESSHNGTLTVDAPAQTPENQAAGAPNIKVCLNRDHGDCDIPQLYPRDTPNALLKVKIPLRGQIETFHEITDIFAPGEGTAAILGNETGAWIMAGNASAAGEWASMRNPTTGETFVDYVEKRHFVDAEGFVGTRLTWDIPMDEAIFGVGADTTGTLFKRFENVQWEIRIKVKSQDTIDLDGDVNTTEDRFHPFTDDMGNPETIETVFVAENADMSNVHSDWVFEDKLPFLYFEYSCIAKGTLISMADGTTKAIEDVYVGDLVATADGVKEVQDTSIGYEAIPMISLTDSLGNNVLLTETHPVVTARGVVWANEVVTGDVLSTDAGSSTVVAVSAVMFNDTVHNLELEPVKGADAADETMFANGIAVGDLGYQSALTFKDKAKTTVESMLEALPEEWHQDYLNSLKQ